MIAIVILNYNNVVDIKHCIDSVLQYESIDDLKFIIVDNGSLFKVYSDVENYLNEKFTGVLKIHENDIIKQILPKCTYLRLNNNYGYARGNNAGLELVYDDDEISHVMILNSDIVFTEKILPSLVKVCSNSNIGAVSPLLLQRDGIIDYCCARKALSKKELLLTFSYVFASRYALVLEKQRILKNNPHLISQHIVDIELPSGSCMLFRKKILQSIGAFDSNTFLYYEENILYKKILKLGLKNVLLTSSSCIHTGGVTTNKTKNAYFLKRCNYDSLLYYLTKYEKCSRVELLYFKITANVRLFRLWLGMIYHKIIK